MTKVVTISAEKLAEKIETKLEKQLGTQLKITKAKFGKGVGLIVNYDKTVTRSVKNSEGDEEILDFISTIPGEEFRFLPHPDLVLAFDLLRSHLALLCDLRECYSEGFTISPAEMDDTEGLLEKIKVTGFSIGGSSDQEGVTLIGSKILRGGKVLNLVAPFTKFEEQGDDSYPYATELSHLIDHASNEVLAYMDGKIADGAQLNLFEESNDSDLAEEPY